MQAVRLGDSGHVGRKDDPRHHDRYAADGAMVDCDERYVLAVMDQ